MLCTTTYLQKVLSCIFLTALTLEADFQKTYLPSLMVFLAGPHQQQWKLAESRQQRIDEDCFREELFSPNVTPADNIPATRHRPAFWKFIQHFSKETLLKPTAIWFTAAPTPNVWVCANRTLKKKIKNIQPAKQKTKTTWQTQNIFKKRWKKCLPRLQLHLKLKSDFSACKALQTCTLTQSAVAKLEAGLALPSKQDATSPAEEPWIPLSVNLFW